MVNDNTGWRSDRQQNPGLETKTPCRAHFCIWRGFAAFFSKRPALNPLFTVRLANINNYGVKRLRIARRRVG